MPDGVPAQTELETRRPRILWCGWAIAERLGDNAYFVPADITVKTELAAVVDTAVDRYGGLDVMFNNAGVAALEGTITDCPEEIFDRTLEFDIKAVWLGIKL